MPYIHLPQVEKPNCHRLSTPLDWGMTS
jgi:hypothetical protein